MATKRVTTPRVADRRIAAQSRKEHAMKRWLALVVFLLGLFFVPAGILAQGADEDEEDFVFR